jgi:2-polyprenyl-3-methyl-5-hydroxy-6-metoxy-1,4-benzoquinol methylase
MYEVLEISMANARQLLDYKKSNIYGTEFSIKGFDYPWIIKSNNWSPSDKVLDIGAGYSMLPAYLADTYGCEVWAVDDFGMDSSEPFWQRNQDPQEHINKYLQVRFVLERLGDIKRSSLPENYFDCIYSASTLEHIPTSLISDVWRHMDILLKPGGVMLHALDLSFPTYRGLLSVLKAMILDNFRYFLPPAMRVRHAYYTPKTYVRNALRAIGERPGPYLRDIGVLKMILDPEIVLEPLDWAFNRTVKDGMMDVVLLRVASLLIHLKKGKSE